MQFARPAAQVQFASWRWLRPQVHTELRSLLAAETVSADELQGLQDKRLRRLARHAYANVPFFRRRFDEAGLDPERLTVASLGRLPILEKEEVQASRDDLTARAAAGAGVRANQSGGSTGAPVVVLQNDAYRASTVAALTRDHMRCGYRFGDAYGYLWGSDYDARGHDTLIGRLKDFVQNLYFVNAFSTTSEELAEFAIRLHQMRASLLVGYVSALTALADVIQERGLETRVGAIQTAAETLTETQRRHLRTAFDAEVFNRYGCREVGPMAHECAYHAGLHVIAENNVVEVVDDRGAKVGPGQIGHLVVTNLRNWAMPMLRYRLGDVGTAADGSACKCGRPHPRIDSIDGRTSDVITSPSGRLIHGEFFTHLFYGRQDVAQFRVDQLSLRKLRISIKPRGVLSEETVPFLGRVINEHGDRDFDLEFVITDDIAVAPSGKRRFTVSNVPLELSKD